MRRLVKRAAEIFAPSILYAFKERRYQKESYSGNQQTTAQIFGEIYAKNMWGGGAGAFYSGNGSDNEASAGFIAVAKEIIANRNVTTVVDLGCGDFRVGEQIAEYGRHYIGIDIVHELIERNNTLYGTERTEFRCLDIVQDDLPDAELCVIRQVLQHLSNEQIGRVLHKAKKYKYVLIGEHHPSAKRYRAPNIDKPTGASVRVAFGSGVYVDRAPFLFPAKLVAEFDVPPLIAPSEKLAIYLFERDDAGDGR